MNLDDRNAAKAEAPPAAPGKPDSPWIMRSDAIALLVLATLFTVSVTVIVVRQARTGRGVEVVGGEREVQTWRVDVNSAAVGELMLLPAIGTKRAQRIVEWREKHGRLRNMDDLQEATGISGGQGAELHPLVTFGPLTGEGK